MSGPLNPLRAEVSSPLLEKAGFRNIYHMFERSESVEPGKTVVIYKLGKGHWASMSYFDMMEGSRDCASALLALGIDKGDRVGFICNNRFEWTMTDLGVHRIGAVNVTNYVTPDPEKFLTSEVAFNLNDSATRIVFVAAKYLHKVEEAIESGEFKTIERVVVLDREEGFDGNDRMLPFNEFLQLGKRSRKLLDDHKEKVDLNDTATIIYTSGSTGVPKGVVLTHGNLLSNVENILSMVDLRRDDVEMSFLPLGHIFERIISYLIIRFGGTIGYAESIETIADDAQVIRPTVFPAVPRVFEKFKTKVEDNAASKGGLSLKIYKWSTRTGREFTMGKRDPLTRIKYSIAKKLVFDKVSNKLGGRVRFFVSSSAPLCEDTANFFKSMNFEILEAYGMTEAGPLISVNRNGKARIGTVGEFIPELKYELADDGELLIKGPSIMKGFWNRPEAEKETFSRGWLLTGDIGRVSKDGYLTLTDRKKNLIKTSQGKYVPPAPIEDKLVSNEFISQAMVIGDRRPHCSAIIVPAFQRLEGYAQKNNIHYTSYRDLVQNPSIIRFYQGILEKETSTFANHERPKKIILGDKEWTWEGGELTPTQKVKRTVIIKHFKDQIDSLYGA